MRKRACRILALALAFGFAWPQSPSVAAPLAPRVPELNITDNCLYIDGVKQTSVNTNSAYQFLYFYAETEGIDNDTLNDSQIQKFFKLSIDPLNMRSGCILYNKYQLELVPGDIIYARKINTIGQPTSDWGRLVVTGAMFGLESARTMDDLPLLNVTETTLILVPPSLYTRYEYCALQTGDTQPVWIAVGSLAEGGGSTTITVSFQPRSVAHEFRVRIAGDDKPGFLYRRIVGIPVAVPRVFLREELLGPFGGGPEGRSWYISTDGGKKWTLFTAPPYIDRVVDLTKVFGNKEVTIVVKEYDKDKSIAECADIVRGTYQPRPKFPGDIKVFPFVSEQYPANYTFSGLSPMQSYEYRVEGRDFYFMEYDRTVGLPLLTERQQSAGRKPAKVFLRLPADEYSSTPSSAPKKYNQVKQTKAPKMKPDYKKETIKTKSDIYMAVGEVGGDPSGLPYALCSGDPEDISGYLTERKAIYMYTAETEKKSRSALQVINLAPRDVKPDKDDGITFDKAKGKLTLVKGFEVLGASGKWGNLKKGEKTVLLRRKATAKFNTKSGTSSGLAASVSTRVTLAYSDDGKTVTDMKTEEKPMLPLAGIGISIPSGGNGSVAYRPEGTTASNIYSPGVYTYYVAQSELYGANFAPRVTDFTITLTEQKDEAGRSLISDATLTRGSDEIPFDPDKLLFDCSGSKLGDVITLTLTPYDMDAYKITTYTFRVIEPLAAKPGSVAFGAKTQAKAGTVTVRLTSALAKDQYVNVAAEIYKVTASGEVKIAENKPDTRYYEYNALHAELNNNFSFDFADEILADAEKTHGGDYRAYAYIMGEAGATSHSERVRADLTVGLSDMKVNVIKTSVIYNSDYPPPAGGSRVLVRGDTLRFDEALDALGNTISPMPDVEWLVSDKAISKDTDPNDDGTDSGGKFSVLSVGDSETLSMMGRYVGIRAVQPDIIVTAPVSDKPVAYTLDVMPYEELYNTGESDPDEHFVKFTFTVEGAKPNTDDAPFTAAASVASEVAGVFAIEGAPEIIWESGLGTATVEVTVAVTLPDDYEEKPPDSGFWIANVTLTVALKSGVTGYYPTSIEPLDKELIVDGYGRWDG
ncbi:MAG: hypothetical protein LBI44_05865 [Oscillospiraceae bacterium]|nr:hypothetical protein [Oscillospiraceae bacterium]